MTVSNASGNNRFAIDGEEIPAKTLVRGATYRFMQSNTSNNGQPFYIATSDTGAGADAYGTGWAYEGAAGDDGIGLLYGKAVRRRIRRVYQFNCNQVQR